MRKSIYSNPVKLNFLSTVWVRRDFSTKKKSNKQKIKPTFVAIGFHVSKNISKEKIKLVHSHLMLFFLAFLRLLGLHQLSGWGCRGSEVWLTLRKVGRAVEGYDRSERRRGGQTQQRSDVRRTGKMKSGTAQLKNPPKRRKSPLNATVTVVDDGG